MKHISIAQRKQDAKKRFKDKVKALRDNGKWSAQQESKARKQGRETE